MQQNLEQTLPNYYQWSLCDIESAYNDLFHQMPSRLKTYSENYQLEPLSYFNYKNSVDDSSIYLQQHFGTSQMNKPHPMRNSIPCEEIFRWIPVRTSSIIGRRAHLPLDVFQSPLCQSKKEDLF